MTKKGRTDDRPRCEEEGQACLDTIEGKRKGRADNEPFEGPVAPRRQICQEEYMGPAGATNFLQMDETNMYLDEKVGIRFRNQAGRGQEVKKLRLVLHAGENQYYHPARVGQRRLSRIARRGGRRRKKTGMDATTSLGLGRDFELDPEKYDPFPDGKNIRRESPHPAGGRVWGKKRSGGRQATVSGREESRIR